MKKYAPHSHILGVVISGRSINAVLVDDTPEGPQVVQRFSRQAIAFADSDGETFTLEAAFPGFYTVALTVTDPLGAEHTDAVQVLARPEVVITPVGGDTGSKVPMSGSLGSP